MQDLTVRKAIKLLLDFNMDAKVIAVHDGTPLEIEDFSWAVSGGDGSTENRNIEKEKANATFVYINCDKSEN